MEKERDINGNLIPAFMEEGIYKPKPGIREYMIAVGSLDQRTVVAILDSNGYKVGARKEEKREERKEISRQSHLQFPVEYDVKNIEVRDVYSGDVREIVVQAAEKALRIVKVHTYDKDLKNIGYEELARAVPNMDMCGSCYDFESKTLVEIMQETEGLEDAIRRMLQEVIKKQEPSLIMQVEIVPGVQ